MHGPSTQEFLFQRIREKLPLEVSLSDRIADLLNISADSAYRRIRGETPLVLEEAKILCDAFGLSLDQLFSLNEKSAVFTLKTVDNNQNSFDRFLTGMLKDLTGMAASEPKQIIYLSKDIPLFHNFHYRPLFAFRYFFWMKSILQHPDFQHRKFSVDCLPADIERKGKQILEAYNIIPSVEIWNTECVNSTIQQVAWYREAGYFASDDEVGQVFGALSQTIEHMCFQAECGSKFLPGENPDVKKTNFEFFHNRMVLGDNTILALAKGKKTLYFIYEILNYMYTQDEKICTEIHDKLQALMRRSTILSQVSEKQRNIFFNILQRKIPKHSPSNALPS